VSHLASVAALGAVLAAACVPDGPSMTATHAAAIRDSAQALLDTFQRYAAEGRWDSLASLYANDADFRWLEQGTVQYRSAAQIREALRRVGPGTRIESSYLDTRVVALAPGAAAIATTFHTKLLEGGAERLAFGGVLDLVLVHREGGWRILFGHSSSRQR
jgi:hypothetical protein